MAHKVLGVDLGSHTVKVVELTLGFRTVQATAFYSAPVQPGDEPVAERAMRALAQLIVQKGLHGEQRFEALGGDGLMIRLLSLPFSDAKKIDMVVGNELEAQIARDVDEVVFDHRILAALEDPAAHAAAEAAAAAGTPSAADAGAGAGAGAAGQAATPAASNQPAPGSPPGAVAPTPGTKPTRVLVAAALRSAIKAHLERSAAATGSEPRALLAAPLVLGQVVKSDAPVGILDMGHSQTTLSVVLGGVTLMSRTLPRGGRHVSAAVARRWQIHPSRADEVKHGSAFVAPRAQLAALTPEQRAVHDLCVGELSPMVRDLRQTLAAFRASFGVAPSGLQVCGGASRLQGVVPWLGEALELPVEALRLAATPELAPLAAALDIGGAAPELALVLGIGLEGASGRASYDFRQDEFAYKVDYSFLRQRAVAIASASLTLIALAAVMAWSELSKLKKEERILSDRFDTISMEVLNRPIDPEDAETEIRPGKAADSPLPRVSAYDLLDDISRALPERDKIKLDITELEIKVKKISLKATVASAEELQALEAALKSVKCIGDIQKGKMTAGVGPNEKQFTMTIAHSCM